MMPTNATYADGQTPQCTCHACIKAHDIRDAGGRFPLSATRMILCPICGNKRCPHATDHRCHCTGSNEPGQPGSAYARTSTAEGGQL
jgi:hypothetical protein